MNHSYQLGLLCLTHLLIGADGVVDDHETDAMQMIRDRERIDERVFLEFEALIRNKKEQDIYQVGIDLVNRCTTAEKLKTFVTLYKLSEVDGRVHVKEIRLLLYSLRLAGIDFDDVVTHAMAAPSLI